MRRMVSASIHAMDTVRILSLAWASADELRQVWLIGAVASGELIDRYEFYRELVFVTPRTQVAGELLRLLGRAA